ncbi:MAG: IS3 family transposase [Actinomycetota bacterium]|nr:IS3 family transposase [Actinomycetota bacterium]
MHAEQAHFPIAFMAREFAVSRQGYAKWVRRRSAPLGPRAASNEALRAEIERIFLAKRCRYGAPRITAQLRREGWVVGENRVARLMVEAGLAGRQAKRWLPRTTETDPASKPAANLVNRDFAPQGPDALWATDITYLATGEGWLYLAAIVDCYSRAVVGWAIATHMRDELCIAALDDAIARRSPPAGLIHHSDRGSQYTSHNYQKRLRDNHIISSMSRKGNCWDNAVAESLWATIKRELTDGESWVTRAELVAALFEYIEVFYNRERLHSFLDNATPKEYDDQYRMSLLETATG